VNLYTTLINLIERIIVIASYKNDDCNKTIAVKLLIIIFETYYKGGIDFLLEYTLKLLVNQLQISKGFYLKIIIQAVI